VIKDKAILACLNKDCDQYHKHRWGTTDSFCNKCGGPIAEDTVQEEGSPVCAWEVSEEIKESLCPYGGELTQKYISIFVPNIDPEPAPGSYRFDKWDPQTEDTEHTAESIQKDLDWYSTNFAEQIKVVKKHYGEENVKLCWGHVGSYS